MAFANTVIGYPIEAPVDYENLVVTKILLDTNGQMKKELKMIVNLRKVKQTLRKINRKFLHKELKAVVEKVKPEKAPKKEKAPKNAPKKATKSPKIVTVVGVPVDAPTSLPVIREENGILVVYPIGITRVVDAKIVEIKSPTEGEVRYDGGCMFKYTDTISQDDLDADTVIDENEMLCKEIFGSSSDEDIEDNGIEKEVVETVEYLVSKVISDSVKIKDWYKDIFKYDEETESKLEEVREVSNVRRSSRIAKRNENSIE